jgi:lipoprotein-anchoring transpeptidase ErfK/SrfK
MTLGVLAAAVALAAIGWEPDARRALEGDSRGGRTVEAAGPAVDAGGAAIILPLPPAFPSTTTLPPYRNLVATVKGPSIDVFAAPDAAVPPSWTLSNPRPSGSAQVFLVTERRGGWLNVMLPVRPNGSTGWIRAADVTVAGHDYRIEVELGAHKLTVFKGAGVFHEEAVGVGVTNTPTPGGRFYTVELFASQKEAYGPFAYGLSGYSEVLYDFAGGDGQFGIHGTSDPSGLGSDVSNGCIRMSNEGITRLAEILPIGVPVEIRA